ncbi:hypothetical protein FW778_13235 [Ginsengibacter hankyongi]|uniref:Lipoprotein n=1 Tax=Ginsengibacter hankyongi TaxID=2607284 RepID=A0A5J5IFH9_9BACT|nr:hypothetical protein [Ginsengibacter hankyongi]KAA9038519.1 hypothetical protein FW778_13235 [Ginsengibacter hankyongi]
MGNYYKIIVIVYALTLLFGCGVTGTSTKYNFSSGYYHSKLEGKVNKKYYVVTSGEDSIKVYAAGDIKANRDSVKSIAVLFTSHEKPANFKQYKFRAEGFDLDVLSIVFKYRPAVAHFPGQLNTNFNGALYAGYRIDNYFLTYNKTPFQFTNRKIRHHGYSIGGFAGVGAAHIDQSVTLNRINYEYDGAVISTGVASEFGFNKITFGVVFGVDLLTDQNKRLWVNEEKPWIGLSIGLNLN